MYTIRKKFKVEYAHQLDGAFSKACSDTIHGHSGIVEIFIESPTLNSDGMVIDFGEISKLIKTHIIELLDHALIIPSSFGKKYIECLKKHNKKLRVVEQNPTAEFFSGWLFDEINLLLEPILKNKRENLTGQDIELIKVRFHETESGYAEYSAI